jgi:hypothetical protein
MNKRVQTRGQLIKYSKQSHIYFLSMIEPKKFDEANKHDDQIRAMNEELD